MLLSVGRDRSGLKVANGVLKILHIFSAIVAGGVKLKNVGQGGQPVDAAVQVLPVAGQGGRLLPRREGHGPVFRGGMGEVPLLAMGEVSGSSGHGGVAGCQVRPGA